MSEVRGGTDGLQKKREQVRRRLVLTQTKRRAARMSKLRRRLAAHFRALSLGGFHKALSAPE